MTMGIVSAGGGGGVAPPTHHCLEHSSNTHRQVVLDCRMPMNWVLPPLSNSWMINITWVYIALNRSPNIDCYWVGAVPNL